MGFVIAVFIVDETAECVAIAFIHTVISIFGASFTIYEMITKYCSLLFNLQVAEIIGLTHKFVSLPSSRLLQNRKCTQVL